MRSLVGLAHRAVVEAELGEAHADGVGADADAVQRRHGVRRGVARRGPSRRAPSRRRRRVAPRWSRRPVRRTGTSPRRSSRANRWKMLEVGALQLARAAGRTRLRHSRVSTAMACPSSAPGWPASAPARGSVGDVDLALDDLAAVERRRQQRPLVVVGPRADVVGDGRSSGRSPGAPGRRSASAPSSAARTAAGRRSTGRRAAPTRGQLLEMVDRRQCER